MTSILEINQPFVCILVGNVVGVFYAKRIDFRVVDKPSQEEYRRLSVNCDGRLPMFKHAADDRHDLVSMARGPVIPGDHDGESLQMIALGQKMLNHM